MEMGFSVAVCPLCGWTAFLYIMWVRTLNRKIEGISLALIKKLIEIYGEKMVFFRFYVRGGMIGLCVGGK